jgi:23S rRNA-/tRNA-specific pseudouridylate synthase
MNRPAIPVLYEDNHLLVIDKPAGLLSQEDSSGHPRCAHGSERLCERKVQQTGQCISRACTQTRSQHNRAYGSGPHEQGGFAAFRTVPQNTPSKSSTRQLSRLLRQKKRTGLKTAWKRTRENRMAKAAWGSAGEKAILEYVVVRQTADRALLEVRLFTGRFHQIRFQLSHAGFPVVGDKKYGSNVPGKLALSMCAPFLQSSHYKRAAGI